ncbi:MAG TPA: sigma-54 dependent transcriptional regulator [Gemmataceae bacterium]|nr:sigma-54 dependent transcriptional regulator [Gemmataceae bacterium]
MPRLLLVDDDPDLIQAQLKHVLGPLDVQVDTAVSGADGLRRLSAWLPDVILLDMRLPDQSGLEVYKQVRQIDARIPVVFITATTAADTAIEAMQQGAYDYLFKPLEPQKLRRVIGDALQLARLMREPAVVAQTLPEDEQGDAIIGCCPAMLEVYKAIGRVARQNVTVLITGESGTGKELVARAIYQHSARGRGPFHAINCAAIPEQLLESELFGHEKGAFTGAERRRIGKFEQCNGGTLFLDEIGDMPLGMQAKILRVLQDQKFERIGGDATIQTDVRLIAATNRDLKSWSVEGRFRPDLYYRLGVFTIALPPLRERGDDLALLVRQYLRRFNRELGREVREVAPDTLGRLRAYSWPGNIRELQSVLKQALLQASGAVLLPSFLPEGFGETGAPAAARSADASGFQFEPFLRQRLEAGSEDVYAEAHRQLDRILLPLALDFTGGNQRLTARLLGIARQTLGVKLREAGLSLKRLVEDAEDDKA